MVASETPRQMVKRPSMIGWSSCTMSTGTALIMVSMIMPCCRREAASR
jgi:hypothetical protein